MSRITDAAFDPACLLCLTPGCWWSPLRQEVVWPSATPRNFASEPATFRDFSRWVAENLFVTNDFRLELSDFNFLMLSADVSELFGLNSSNIPVSIFHSAAQNKLTALTSLASLGGDTFAYINMLNFSTGLHQLTLSLVGQTMTFVVDGTTTSINVPRRTTFSNINAPMMRANATIKSITFTNLTTGKMWHYPSELEQKRLITLANVCDNGQYFHAADTSLAWSIKTALPAGQTGTASAMINNIIVTNPTQWSRTTATFAGAGTDKLHWLLVYNKTLSAAEIAMLSRED
jgi:hypothetical protein